jgi:hypothetical protein
MILYYDYYKYLAILKRTEYEIAPAAPVTTTLLASPLPDYFYPVFYENAIYENGNKLFYCLNVL